jgi:hypothetical protein
MQPCLFCGAPDSDDPEHRQHCTGPRVDLPPLAAGRTPDTRETSEQAAEQHESHRAAQRRIVFDAIRAAGVEGRTDDELQVLLDLDGSSERPRRWELWKAQAIRPRTDRDGHVVHRLTRTRRRAVVWIAA